MWKVALDAEYDGALTLQVRWFLWRWDARPWLRKLSLGDALISLRQRAALLSLARRVRASRFNVSLRYSLGDAGLTALAHGGLCALLSALWPRLASAEPTVDLVPCFDDQPDLRGHMLISITLPAWALALTLLRLGHEKRRESHVQSGRTQGRAARKREEPC